MGDLISDLALLDFKQPVPESGQIELNSIAERYFLAPTQIGEIRREDHLRRFLFLWLAAQKVVITSSRSVPSENGGRLEAVSSIFSVPSTTRQRHRNHRNQNYSAFFDFQTPAP
jgi:hypothetical protein